MKILKFCQLYKKYQKDNKSLTTNEKKLILHLNEEFCEKNIGIHHLSEEEKKDIANNK